MLTRSSIIRVNPQINRQSPQAQGLVAAWPLNDGGGLIAREAMRQNHGTLVNGPVWAQGKNGKAVNFARTSSQYIDLPASIVPTSFPVSLSARVFYADAPVAATYEYTLHIGNLVTGGDLIAIARDGSTGNLYYVENASSKTGTTIPNAQWVDIAMVFTGTAVKSYINGIERTIAQPAGVMTISSGKASIGGLRSTLVNSNYMAGRVEDVRVYSRALSASDVQQIYLRPQDLYAPPRSLLYAATIEEALNLWPGGPRARQVWVGGHSTQQIWTGGHRIL